MKIRNIITNDVMAVDDLLGVDLLKKHPHDFELVNANQDVKKAVEIAQMPSDEAKLLGLENNINELVIQNNNIADKKMDLMTMSDVELIQFCKDKKIYKKSATIENMRQEALNLLEKEYND